MVFDIADVVCAQIVAIAADYSPPHLEGLGIAGDGGP